MRIIILYSSFLKKSDLERLGINFFNSKGLETKILNLTKLINNAYFLQASRDINIKNEIIINDYDHFKNEILNFSKDAYLVISFLHLNKNTYKLYEIISNNNIIYAQSIINVIPDSNFKKNNIFQKIINFKLKNTFFFIKNFYFKFFKSKIVNIKSPKYVIASGSYSTNHPQSSFINDSSRIIWAHSFDYDQFLKVNEFKKNQIKDEYAVFYESPYPLFKNDIYIEGIENTLTIEKFYPSICNFFTYVEKKYNIKIIIAAHPQSRHLDKKAYGYRDIVSNKTAEITKYCKFVILRNSTAITFPVLWKKPMLFYTTDEITKSNFMTNNLKFFTDFFAKKAFNIDSNLEKLDLHKELIIDNASYESYIKNFIKYNQHNDDSLWEIFLNKVDEYK